MDRLLPHDARWPKGLDRCRVNYDNHLDHQCHRDAVLNPPKREPAMTADQSPQPQAPETVGRRRSLTPPKRLWIAMFVLSVLLVIVRGVDLFGDHAKTNIATWILCFIAVVWVAVWFFFRSGHTRFVRLAVFAGCVLVVGVLCLLFRLDHVDGDLSPVFVFRFSMKPDRLLKLPPTGAGSEAVNVDLRTTTKDDFPGFLGPRRDESVVGVRLSRNWTDRPPELVWKQKIGAGWSAFSVVNGHAVTMEQRGEMEMTTCYNVQTGQLEWSHSTEARFERLEAGVGPRSTPTIDEGMVFALGAKGHLACLDGANGKPLWEMDLLKEFDIPSEENEEIVLWGRSASPLVVGEKLIVPIGGRKEGPLVALAAFDKRSGKLLWKGGRRQISYCSPGLATLADVEQILIVNEATASGHDPKTGKVLWEHAWPGHTNADPNVSQAVPLGADQVLLSKGYGGGSMLLKLEPADGGGFQTQVVWKKPGVMKTKFNNVAVLDGCGYSLSDGVLECAKLSNGERTWRQGHYGHGQLLRVGDLLLVLSEKGEVVLVEATPDRPNNVLGRVQAFADVTWNNLALYGPYLLVRNAEEAACYKLPLE
jgi:outer membrane protein assembly factor BamB